VRALVVVIVLADTAAAQVAAVPPEPPRRREWCECGVDLAASLGVGTASEAGRPTGWLARLEYGALFVPNRRNGAVLGITLGVEYWRAAPDWGVDLPLGFVLGARVFPFRATVGVGTDVLLLDQVANSTGVGIYFAPFASAAIGVDAGGWTVMADVRATYRLQLASESRAQYVGAIMVGRSLHRH
jgi:hypothetical protein